MEPESLTCEALTPPNLLRRGARNSIFCRPGRPLKVTRPRESAKKGRRFTDGGDENGGDEESRRRREAVVA